MTSQIAGVDVLRILAKEILTMGDVIIGNDTGGWNRYRFRLQNETKMYLGYVSH